MRCRSWRRVRPFGASGTGAASSRISCVIIDCMVTASVSRTADLAEHNVPVPLTSLIGRSRELDGIGEVLRRTRLVTLTGPAGVGKTRLAIEVARRQIGRRPDGVWLVDLTAGPDPAAEVARTLDVGGRSSTAPTESLRRCLADRDLLLVIDSCEQVIDACARLASSLLSACAHLRILTTSRESLAVSGETVWRLDPLQAEAGHRLFVERARQREPGFIPDVAADSTIAELCERLDRLPLAIELAAARIGVRSLSEILADLEARLGALGGGSRLSPARHKTVRAAVEWSYELLDATEQRAFRNLAVFVGGFDSGAAMAVVPGLTVDAVARLVDNLWSPAARPRMGRRGTGSSKPCASTPANCWWRAASSRAPGSVTSITTWPSRSRWIPAGRRSSRLPFWTSDGRTTRTYARRSNGQPSRTRAPGCACSPAHVSCSRCSERPMAGASRSCCSRAARRATGAVSRSSSPPGSWRWRWGTRSRRRPSTA